MKRITIYTALLLLSSTVYFGCITEFEPKNIEEVRDLLIIDGSITNGESSIVLRYSVGLSESLLGNEYINGASVYVETDAGDIFEARPETRGTYIIPTGDLDTNKQYRLNVKYNGEHYQSTFLTPLITPEIDSISALKKGPGETVYMCVNTHDPNNQSRYYRWSYEEDWEVQAELYANVRLENGEMIEHDLSTSENTYYCWRRDSSKILLLGSTEKLSENLVSNKRLIGIDPANDRLSALYRIAVKQMLLRKEAYDYMSNLQKNIEQTGNIFTPIPSEMNGNISCITNPDLPIIGYIEVATTTQKDRYYPANSGLYEAPNRHCFFEVTTDPDFAPPVYAYFEYYSDYESYAPIKCVDCRVKGSKLRPENWPNNHF